MHYMKFEQTLYQNYIKFQVNYFLSEPFCTIRNNQMPIKLNLFYHLNIEIELIIKNRFPTY
jgi:hypothetical protein